MENNNDYIIVSWNPYNKNPKVDMTTLNNYDDAKKLGNNKRMNGKDVIIVEKYLATNRFTQKEENVYEIKNYGYYKTYRIINFFLTLISIILFMAIIYLYYKYLNSK